MTDEVISPGFNKTAEVKLSRGKNVIPITSLSDLGTVVGEIQNQLTFLLSKLDNEVSPEFKALMEGYVNKANETEELKINLENAKSKYEILKTEIAQVRETNRNLVNELQNAREILRNLESQLSALQLMVTKSEEEHKDKIKTLNKQTIEYESKVKFLAEENTRISQEHEKLREEILDQSFKFRQSEQELVIERDNLKKQLEEFEALLREQNEQVDFKAKELEYKDALIDQLIKQSTTDKLKLENHGFQDDRNDQKKKKKVWFFG